MSEKWIGRLQEEAGVAQQMTEEVVNALAQPSTEHDELRQILKRANASFEAFKGFSREIRDDDLTTGFYSAAAQIEDRWFAILRLLIDRVRQGQQLNQAA